MSVLSLRHDAALFIPEYEETPVMASDKARGSTSSTTLECRDPSWSVSSGSDRQSVKKTDPRESETKNSLLVNGCESTDVRGLLNEIGYAVGWGRSNTALLKLRSRPTLGDTMCREG